MRTIKYKQHEHTWPNPKHHHAVLSTFVYDIPYFGACGIFPPLHICNQCFLRGGGDGGMSPGASWEPFEISQEEYTELVQVLKTQDPKTIKHEARFTSIKFQFDTSFDNIEEIFEWKSQICKKHKANYHSQLLGNTNAT